MRRCYNPKDKDYIRYGARGIRVCDRWQDIANFVADLGEKPEGKFSLDRIDNDGNYELGNVRWATPKEQSNNLRNNRMLTISGRTQTMHQWADEIGISYSTFVNRVERNWPEEKLLKPSRSYKEK